MRVHQALLPVLLCCALSAACAYKVVRHHRLDPDAMDRLLSKVEKLRQLKATSPLRVSLEGRRNLRQSAEGDLHRVSYLSRMEDLSTAWAKVGLVPWGTDLAGAYSSVGSEAPAGYYDTADGILRVIDRNTPRSEFLEAAGILRQRDLMDGEVLSHEITHALQDMHFGLQRFLADAPNDDAALARRCLAEGDASFVGYAYSSVFTPSMETWLRFVESRASALDVRGAPDFVNRRFQLPYLQGARFVGLLHRAGGWKAVNAAYADPPASTEEILHPEKFLKGRDRPVDVRLPDLRGFLPTGSGSLWTDTVGELGLRTVLQRERPAAHQADKPLPRNAAEGWDGDRASVHRTERGELALAWSLVMDTEEDATELFGAYRAMMSRYPQFEVRSESPTQLVASAGGSALWLERRGLRVAILEGYPRERAEAAAKAMFEQPDGHAFDPPGNPDAGAVTDGGDAGADAGPAADGGWDAGVPDADAGDVRSDGSVP